MVTSLRLENRHGTVLAEIAGRVLGGLQRVQRTAVPVIEARQPGPRR